MAEQTKSNSPVYNARGEHRTTNRSAMGVGVTTLVTILVVLLLIAFAVLSLTTANANLKHSEMAARQAEFYYAADSEAIAWYAELDALALTLTGTPDTYGEQLAALGYEVSGGEGEELRVSTSFDINDYQWLAVTVAINDDKTTMIRQWQS